MAQPIKRRKLGTKAAKPVKLERSKLEVFDIPLELIDDSPENPQEMDEATFDALVEGIREEGCDEPIHVIKVYDDEGKWTGRYMLTSGHHRCKACRVVGLDVVPGIVKRDMDDAARKIALVRRNQLRGDLNSKKFTQLFQEVAPILGTETAKRLMGFPKEAAFKRVYQEVSASLPKEARRQMEEAKETVTSVDDLSSILNGIFQREGSKVNKGYLVFSFGGKDHFYFQTDKTLAAILKKLPDEIAKRGQTAAEFFTDALQLHTGGGVAPKKAAPAKKLRKGLKRG